MHNALPFDREVLLVIQTGMFGGLHALWSTSWIFRQWGCAEQNGLASFTRANWTFC